MIIEFDSSRGPQELSNFYVCPFDLRLMIGTFRFKHAEGAYQALKQQPLTPANIHTFQHTTPTNAKSIGRIVTLRPDWEHQRNSAMFYVLMAKFLVPQLRDALCATGDARLVHYSTSDHYWGSYQGVGENWLGRLLMEVRAKRCIR